MTKRRRGTVATGRVDLEFTWDCGGTSRLPNGLEYADTSHVVYSIVEGDPLSAAVRVENTSLMARDGWRVEIAAGGTMTCTADAFLVMSTLDVREDGREAFRRTWEHRFPRDHV